MQRVLFKLGIKSIKQQLLGAFIFFTLIILFMSGIAYYHMQRIQEVTAFNRSIHEIHSNSLYILRMDMDIIDIESINPKLYTTGTTPKLKERQHLLEAVLLALEASRHSAADFGLSLHLDSVRQAVEGYDMLFQNILEKQRTRGFKDFGLEGTMREYAHTLETHNAYLDLEDILSLRRHEKDFFLRNDPAYAAKLNQLVNTLIAAQEQANQSEMRTSIVALLTGYRDTFNELIALEAIIGRKDHSGLWGEMDLRIASLSGDFFEASKRSEAKAASILNQVQLQFVITGLICMLLSLLLSYWIASRISRPIRKLSQSMDRFISMNQLQAIDSAVLSNAPPHEIERLTGSYRKMVGELRRQYHEIGEKTGKLEAQNQQLQKLNEELDHFVYSLSHDLRAPLTSLLGLLEVIRLEESADTPRHYLDMMESSIGKMDRFIQDILHISRNKGLDVDCKEVDLEQLVIELFGEIALVDRNKIKLHVEAHQSTSFHTDPYRLKIILTNLIANAIRYSDLTKPTSWVKVILEVTESSSNIQIVDNGIGIHEDQLPQIFKMFYRATTHSKGTGLGLYIVKQNVNKLGGLGSCHFNAGKGNPTLAAFAQHAQAVPGSTLQQP